MKPLRSSAPVTSILNPGFVYTRSDRTDLAATFERIRQQQQATPRRVVAITKGKKR